MAITQFYLRADKLDMWMHQNGATYLGNCIEGTLLDNFTLSCKNGIAAVYEHPTTEWTSNYRIEFQRGTGQDVMRRWYDFEEKAEEDAREQELLCVAREVYCFWASVDPHELPNTETGIFDIEKQIKKDLPFVEKRIREKLPNLKGDDIVLANNALMALRRKRWMTG